MGLDMDRDAGIGGGRSGRRRHHHRVESRHWEDPADEITHMPPIHHRSSQIQRSSPPMLSRRTRAASFSSGLDASVPLPSPKMPPVLPLSPRLVQEELGAYRRPRGTLAPYDESRVIKDTTPVDRGLARRNSSPPRYHRPRVPGAFSDYSAPRTPSVSPYRRALRHDDEDEDDDRDDDDGDDDDDDDDPSDDEEDEEDDHSESGSDSHRNSGKNHKPNYYSGHIEVEEVVTSGSSRYRRPRVPSRDEYTASSGTDRRRYRTALRRRNHQSSDEDPETEPRHSTSEFATPTRGSSRTGERSDSPPKGHRHVHSGHIIADSRPPVASNKLHRRAYRSTDMLVYHDAGPPRRSGTVRSSRSRAASVSGPSKILENFFGGAPTPPSRRSSPEKLTRAERHTRTEKPAKIPVDCVICMEETSSSKGANLKCGHRMCNSCLKRIFEMSITDPQHMPPRCCAKEHIPLKHVDRLFDHSFKKTWNRKFSEFTTRNRLYCINRKCGEWIKPENIRREDGNRKMGRCSRCKTKVCAKCGTRWHHSSECPRDDETKRFLDHAKEEGWKRCYKCKVIVELKEGCNHMTCRCGAEFCMVCGTKWKGCSCPWFNDTGSGSAEEQLEAERIRNMNMSSEDIREILRSKREITMELLRTYSRPTSLPVRPRPLTYDEEFLLRRLQEQRDGGIARRIAEEAEDDIEDDDVGHIVGIGNAAGHFMNQNYTRSSTMPIHPPAPQPGYGRGGGYVADASRTRGPRDSMEQRLADRFSDSRASRPRRMVSPPPAPPLRSHMMYPMGSPLAHPADMAMGMGMGMGLGLGVMTHAPPPPAPAVPPGPPMMRRELALEDDRYLEIHDTPRSMHAAPFFIEENHSEGEESYAYSPRSRRPRHVERPKSSTLAGLNGYGRGMHRVFEWRNFVEPGMPEGEA